MGDKNGFLSYDELLGMLKKRGNRGSEKKLQKLFNTADTSGDGLISLDENLVSMGERPEKDHKEALMRNCFKGFDKDNNGVIDRIEMKQVFREMGRYLSEFETGTMMNLVDTDGSGDIDYEEFIAHFFGKIQQAKKDEEKTEDKKDEEKTEDKKDEEKTEENETNGEDAKEEAKEKKEDD